MAIRLPLAFVIGLAIYMIAMLMTTYDGALSLILQPIIGAVLTAVGLVVMCIVCSPLLIAGVWHKWRRLRWWTLLLTLIGLAALVASWHPALRVSVVDPDTQALVESFHPALAIGGWFLAMFGVAFCPAIGLTGDRRWA